MPLSLPRPPSPVSPEIRAEAIRAAKQFLNSIIRDDWGFPPSGPAKENEADSRQPTDYRPPLDAPSDLEDSFDDIFNSFPTPTDPYKFETPDAIGEIMLERQRKRRRLDQEEMKWNEGLRHWSRQRDAWTGALTDSAKLKSEHSKNDFHIVNGCEPSSPLSQSSGGAQWPTLVPNLSAEDNERLLPVYPPLFPPDAAVRSSIRPAIYPTLYSRVVIQGLTPNVPIPLPDMVDAMVQGWKAEDNWPPRETVDESRKGGMLRFRKKNWGKNGQAPSKQEPHENGRAKNTCGAMRVVPWPKKVKPDSKREEEGLDEGELGIEFEEENQKVAGKEARVRVEGAEPTDLKKDPDNGGKEGNVSDTFRMS